jgi:hypothetical protein
MRVPGSVTRLEDAMDYKTKLGLGSVLGALGALGVVLSPILGATGLGRPWSFLVGFGVGVVCGMGTALAVSGLLDMRKLRG